MKVADRTSEYRIWLTLRSRCNNPKATGFHRYGGRGIKCCSRWDSFKLFLKDMGPRPSKKHSIERRNNDKGYTPRNCYWGTSKQQSRNNSRNVKITYKGRTLVLQDWAEVLGIKHETLQHRIYAGWPIALAFTVKPPYHGRRHKIKPEAKTKITIDGKTLPVTEWARKKGVLSGTVHARLYRGWSPREAVYGKKK